MNPPVWVVEAAERFWRDAGRHETSWPRDLESAIMDSLNLSPCSMPNLTLFKIRDDLIRRRVPIPMRVADRPVRGCLVARRGVGYAYVDSLDPPEERRFTLAHELAHFLRDHCHYRERAEKFLGSRGVAIFDGVAPPSLEDELQAGLRDIGLHPNVHLLERDGGSFFEIERVEEDADRLALEILAPFREVREILRHFPRAEAVSRLEVVFGLPRWAAESLARADEVVESPLLRRLKNGLTDSAKKT